MRPAPVHEQPGAVGSGRLQGRVALISGGDSGIGRATALAFAREGADAMIIYLEEDEDARETARGVERWGRRCELYRADIGQESACQEAVAATVECFGRLDILVNNSGISQRSAVFDTDIAVDRRVFEVNYFGAIGLTKQVLPWFREQGGGLFVVVSSLVGELSTPMRSAYAASKHALHGWFEALRAEEHEHGIRVLMVMPGFVHTQVSVNAVTADGTPHGRMDDHQVAGLSAEACAQAVLRAVRREREQVIIAGREKAGILLKRLAPSLYRKIIRRIKVT